MNEQQKMYFDLYEKCLEISNRIDSSMLNSFDELDEVLRKALLIDNKLVDNDLFYELENDINDVYNDLKSYEQVLISKFQS